MQAQAQHRVAMAMQSHALAQQYAEQAMQQRQNAQVAMQNAQMVLMIAQEQPVFASTNQHPAPQSTIVEMPPESSISATMSGSAAPFCPGAGAYFAAPQPPVEPAPQLAPPMVPPPPIHAPNEARQADRRW